MTCKCLRSAGAALILVMLTALPACTVESIDQRSSGSPQVHPGSSGPNPLLVLIQYDPWAMVIGSDSPSFALYDDGTAIYWKGTHGVGRYVSVQLTSGEASELLDRVNRPALLALDSRYQPAAGITDAPDYLMVLRKPDGTYKDVSVYGWLDGGPSFAAKAVQLNGAAPKAFGDAVTFLTAYVNERAKEWLPDLIEVMIWPYEYAPERDLEWPKDWPGVGDARTTTRGDGYSLFLDKTRCRELYRLLSRRKQRQAVRIDGKKWAVAVRFPFPNEHIWTEIRSRTRSEH